MGFIQDCTKNIDLKAMGLDRTVEDNIRRNRMSSARIRITDSQGKAVKSAKVTVNQIKSDFKFGCNAFIADHLGSQEKNKRYDDLFANLFNQAVVPFYWRDDEPERGKTRFERGSEYIYRRPDAPAMLDFCERTGCQPKGHNLVWQNETIGIPKWFPRDDKNEALRLIDRRIRQVAALFADKIPVWDVTNETIDAPGAEFMPRNFDLFAWKLATELFPGDHLILNDYHCFFEDYHGQQTALFLQAERLMEHGCRVDGIGMQYHLFTKKEELHKQTERKINAEYMLDMMAKYGELGNAMHVSEITVPSYEGSEESLENQLIITENLYKLWFSMPNVESIVWWNLADGYSFVDAERPWWDENYYGGGLLTHDLDKKPAYEVLDRLINKEWRTNLSDRSDGFGNVQFEGFHGIYDVTVEVDGKKITQQIHLSKGGANRFDINI